MKILLANKYFYPKGGAETVFLQERDFLKHAGIEVVDFSMQHPQNLPSNYASYFVKNRDYKDQSIGVTKKVSSALSLLHSEEAVRNLIRLIEQEQPDILHCHNIYHQLTPSILRAAKASGVKVILTLHDYKIICPVYTRQRHGAMCDLCKDGAFFNVLKHRCAEGSLAKSALLFAEAELHKFLKSYEAVDRFIAVSKFMRDSVITKRFHEEKISLLYNGVDIDMQDYGQPEGKPYVLYFGRLSHEKGLKTLARAQEGSGVRVVVAGTGPLEAELRRDYPGLELVGFQNGAPLKRLVAQAAAVVVPSEWYENCPMTVLEAMAGSTAVIGSRIGGIPELVEDGKTGFLFEAGDAAALRDLMVRVTTNTALCKSLGANGGARLREEFSFKKHNDGLLRIYEELLGG